MIQSTHSVEVGEREVVKRFRSWNRGEAVREWDGLILLRRHAPGLGPTPLRFDPSDGGPTVAMSRLPGVSLGAGHSVQLSTAQVAAVGVALRAMFAAVPAADLLGFGERRSGPRELAAALRTWCREPHQPCGPTVESALDDATRWVASPGVTALTSGPLAERVFGLGDGNIGNYVWDGHQCRVVDFEDCGVSDPTYEVADLVEHVSVSLHGLLPADDLVASFGFDLAQRQRLLEFRRLMSLFWLLMLLPGNRAHARNREGSLERQAERMRGLLNLGV